MVGVVWCGVVATSLPPRMYNYSAEFTPVCSPALFIVKRMSVSINETADRLSSLTLGRGPYWMSPSEAAFCEVVARLSSTFSSKRDCRLWRGSTKEHLWRETFMKR